MKGWHWHSTLSDIQLDNVKSRCSTRLSKVQLQGSLQRIISSRPTITLFRIQLISSCGGKELIKELLDPDYIPGSLKSVPQGSIETITNVLASSSSSSPRTSSRGLPVTPDTHFMEQAKLRGRAHSLRTSANDCSSLPLDPGLPLPLSSFDEAVEDVATSLNGLHPGPSNHSNRSNEFKIPYAQNQVQNDTNEVNYDFMAMAMNMNTSLEGEMDFGSTNDTGGDFGFGFDINNFSFDMGDFTALLGQQGQGQGQEWDGRAGGSGQYGP